MRWTVKTNRPVEFSASGGTPPYSWLSPGGEPEAGSGSEYATTYTSKGRYIVTVTDGEGETGTLDVRVVTQPTSTR